MTREQAPKRGTTVRVGRQSQGAYRQAHRAVGRQLGEWQDAVQSTEHTSVWDASMYRIIGRQLTRNARVGETL